MAVHAPTTGVAYAALLIARARPNPTLNAAYSKSAPQYHVTADLPIDYPGLRAARVRAERASGAASIIAVVKGE